MSLLVARRFRALQLLILVSCAAVSAVSAGASWLGQSRTTQDCVRARSFEVVDEDGRVWCRLAPPYMGAREGGIYLYDAAGQDRMRVGVSRDGLPCILFKDDEGGLRMELAIGLSSEAGITQYTPGGEGRASLSVRDFSIFGGSKSSSGEARTPSWAGRLQIIGENGEQHVVGTR